MKISVETLKEAEKKQEETQEKYPLLKIATVQGSEVIVLFFGKETGVYLKDDLFKNEIEEIKSSNNIPSQIKKLLFELTKLAAAGTFSKTINEENFKKYSGEISLSNNDFGDNEYPKLMQCKNNGIIVLFMGEGKYGEDTATGICLYRDGNIPSGESSDGWNKSSFIPFHGKIILSND